MTERPRSYASLARFGAFILLTLVVAISFDRVVLGQPETTPVWDAQFSDPVVAPKDWDFQYDLFASLLEYQGLRPAFREFFTGGVGRRNWDDVLSEPAQSVVVFTGSLRKVRSTEALHRFIRQGGVVLVASNHSLRIPGITGIQFGPVTAANDRVAYQSYADCLELRDFDRSSELFSGVDCIVTNCCGWISSFQRSDITWSWEIPLRFPQDVRPAESVGKPLLAVSRSRRAAGGKIIVLADGSPLTNGMLWHGGNVQFAINLSRMLVKNGRTKFAFLHHGVPVASRIDEMLLQEAASRVMPSIPPSIPPEALSNLPLETLTKVANHVISRVEDSNVLNKVAVDRPRGTAARFYRRGILLFIAGLAAMFFLLRSWLTARPGLPWTDSGDRRPADEARETRPSLAAAARTLAEVTCRQLTNSTEAAEWSDRLAPRGSRRRELREASHIPQYTEQAVDRILEWVILADGRSLTESEFVEVGKAAQHLRQITVDSPVNQTSAQAAGSL